MGLKRPVMYGGKKCIGTDMAFKPIDAAERTIFLKLTEDGTIIKFTFAITAVYKVDNEIDATGTPIYVMDMGQGHVVFLAEEKPEPRKQ